MKEQQPLSTPLAQLQSSETASLCASSFAQTWFAERKTVCSQLFTLTDGFTPLVMAATPLLYCLPKLRSGIVKQDPDYWHTFLCREVAAFEQHPTLQQYPHNLVLVARYWLCTVLDEVICQSDPELAECWPIRALSTAILHEPYTGHRFTDFLKRTNQGLSLQNDMLELLYLSLSLGFEGNERLADPHISLDTCKQQFYLQLRQYHGEHQQRLVILENSTTLLKKEPGSFVNRPVSVKWSYLLVAGFLVLVYVGSVWFSQQIQQPLVTKLFSQVEKVRL